MNRHARILLLESGRYQSLLIERELTSRVPDSIVVVFRAAESAEIELLRSIYDVAILDADLTGIGLFRQLRDLLPDLPLIALTGIGDNGLAPELVAIPNVYVLTKSQAIPAAVSTRVQQLLSRRPTGLTAVAAASLAENTTGNEVIQMAVGTLAHEVNNPLMTILGETELLLGKTGIDDEDVIRKIQIIRKSAGRIASALVRLSRISEMEPSDTDAAPELETEKV